MEREIQQGQQEFLLEGGYRQMLNEKERQISKLTERVEIVSEENLQLKRQLERVCRDNELLKRKIQDDPLYNIFSDESSHPSNDPTHAFSSYKQLQQRISVYHQQQQKNARQILLLHNKLNERQNTIISQQQQILTNIESIDTLERDCRLLKEELHHRNQQISRYQQAIESYQAKMNNWQKTFQNVVKSVETQNQQDNKEILQQGQQFYLTVQTWIQISEHILKKVKQPNQQLPTQSQLKDLKQINNIQKRIMEDLGRELDQRNEIINQLKEEVIRLKAQHDHGVQYYANRHTMAEMINTSRAREEKDKQMVEKFKSMVDALAKSVEEKDHLRRQYLAIKAELENFIAQRDEINALKSEYENYKKLYETTNQSLRFLEENMVQVLTENEALHNFMYQTRGSKAYMQVIKEELRKYEIQQKQRQREFKWSNVTQLINMNIKLMNRIKQRSLK